MAENGQTTQFRFNMLLPPEMARAAANAGLKKVQMDFFSMMMLSIMAGMFIGIAANFCTTLWTGGSVLPYGINKLIGGLAFCMGLILVIVAGAELFTGNNLIVMAVASGKVALRYLIWNWIVVYAGNLIGSLLIAWLVWISGQDTMANGEIGKLAVKIGESKCALEFWPALVRGIICNWLVCLAVWLCFSARSTTDKIMAILFPITAFVACGYEHCVANMYFIGVGLFLKGSYPMVDAPNLTWANFFVKDLLPVTIGNIIGGAVFIGLIFWIIYCRREPKYRSEMK